MSLESCKQAVVINGRRSFWDETRSFFLYWQSTPKRWAICQRWQHGQDLLTQVGKQDSLLSFTAGATRPRSWLGLLSKPRPMGRVLERCVAQAARSWASLLGGLTPEVRTKAGQGAGPKPLLDQLAAPSEHLPRLPELLEVPLLDAVPLPTPVRPQAVAPRGALVPPSMPPVARP